MTTPNYPPPGPYDPYGQPPQPPAGGYPPQPPPGGYPQQPPPGPYSPTPPPGPHSPTPPAGYPPPQPPPGGYQAPPPSYPPQGPPTYPPAGPPYGQPGGQGPKKRSAAPIVFSVTAVIVVLLVAVAAFAVFSHKDVATADEVFLQAADEPGADPFTAPVATPPASGNSTGSTTAANAPTTPPTVKPASGGGQRTYDGGQPGLYGGTRDIGSCDKEKMLTFLDQNPDKKAAWAGVLGIPPSEVRTYVNKLTSVVLRTDTYVTNHGFADGRATSFQAVLQAGTAVMVDEFGFPRVKCYCGNPLTAPNVYRSPVYQGRRWSWFNLTTIVVIKQNVTIIDNFLLLDRTGQPFTRPAGGDGGTDKDGPSQPPPDPSGGTMPPATPAPTESTTTTLPIFEVPTQPTAPPPTFGPAPTNAPSPTPTHQAPVTPPPTHQAPVTPPPTQPQPAGPSIGEARTYFLNRLGGCALSNATNQSVSPTGSNSFSASATFFVGGHSVTGHWTITYNGSFSMVPADQVAAENCS